jgi:hypothetical protein
LQNEPSWHGAQISGPPTEDNPAFKCISCQTRRDAIPPQKNPHKLQRRPSVTQPISLTIRPLVLFATTDTLPLFVGGS